MKPARFTYEAPTTVAGALAALAARGERAKVIAGGQSLAPMMNMRVAQPEHLVDINRIGELAQIRAEDGHIVCGALVRHADLARHDLTRAHTPMLAFAAGTIGHYAIRQRGTLGGSLAHADPAAQLPLVSVALDARIEIASAERRRSVPAAEFFRSMLETALQPDELLVSVRFPIANEVRGWGFRFYARRAGDFALALVACELARVDEGVGSVKITVGGVGEKPERLDSAVRAGRGDAAWIAEMGRSVARAALVEEGERIPVAYRRELVEALVSDALTDALKRAA